MRRLCSVLLLLTLCLIPWSSADACMLFYSAFPFGQCVWFSWTLICPDGIAGSCSGWFCADLVEDGDTIELEIHIQAECTQ